MNSIQIIHNYLINPLRGKHNQIGGTTNLPNNANYHIIQYSLEALKVVTKNYK